MTNALITQAGAEASVTPTPKLSVTQAGAEVSSASSGVTLRITQAGAEVGGTVAGTLLRITQCGVEVSCSFLQPPTVAVVGMCLRQLQVTASATSALSYSFYRATSAGGIYTLLATQAGGVYLDTVPLANTTYYYQVLATYVQGTGPLSAPASAQAMDILGQMTPPTAAVPGEHAVTLTWAAFPGASSYAITRNGVQIATGITNLSYVDTNVQNGVSYSYQLAALNPCGTGPLSGSVAAVPQCCQFEYTADVVTCGGFTPDSINCGGFTADTPIPNASTPDTLTCNGFTADAPIPNGFTQQGCP